MQEKALNIVLSVVGVIGILAFLASLLYEALTGAILSLKNFGVTWLFIYVFAVTLGFKGNLDAHKNNLNKFAIEWVITCMVGLLPIFILLIYG
nr:hypothetical protein [Candidatus Njordarchaeum guaymaensis]